MIPESTVLTIQMWSMFGVFHVVTQAEKGQIEIGSYSRNHDAMLILS